MENGILMSKLLPDLLCNMRNKRCKKNGNCLDGFFVNSAVVLLCDSDQLVCVFHKSGHYGIQAEGLKSAGDIVYHLMTGLLHLFGSRDIFLNAVKSQIPETFQESGYTIDSSVIPFCIQFRRSYEQLIHT